jgi:hypothetical protein
MSDMSVPPFRADHVGSLLRPPELLRARAEQRAGRLSARESRRAEDDAIRDAVRMPYLVRLLPLHQDKPRDTPEALGFLRIAATGCRFVEMPQPQSRVQQ